MTAASSESPRARDPKRVLRRTFITGAVGALAAAAPVGAAAADASPSTWAEFKSQGIDGTTLVYPANWTLDPCTTLATSLDPNYLYPTQAFGLHSVARRPGVDLGPNGGGEPDFSVFPRNAVAIWLRYYDSIVETAPFGVLSLDALSLYGKEYGFASYLSRFSNSARTYLLKVWVGPKAGASAVPALDTTLKSIRIPA